MSIKTLAEDLKHRAGQAKTLHVDPILESGQGAAAIGIETLKSAGAVVSDSVGKLAETQRTARSAVAEAAQTARAEAVATVTQAGEELRSTLQGGYRAVTDRLARAGSPSHRLQAEARKAEVKAKKKAQRAATAEA